MSDQHYYEQQLNQLNDPGTLIRIQLTGTRLSDGEYVKTNYMNLNSSSIEALRAFLDTAEKALSL